jgi:hypothetical protein
MEEGLKRPNAKATNPQGTQQFKMVHNISKNKKILSGIRSNNGNLNAKVIAN